MQVPDPRLQKDDQGVRVPGSGDPKSEVGYGRTGAKWLLAGVLTTAYAFLLKPG
jgi:hypothetical protein